MEIESEVSTNPKFWNDPTQSTKVLKEKKALETSFKSVEDTQKLFDDTSVLIEFAESGDADSDAEANELLKKLSQLIDSMETQRFLGGETDANSAIITINAGAGGTEACDWAQIVMRMLTRYAGIKGWKVHLVDELAGEGAGIKNATLSVDGDYAYGLMKSETGVHRLVRISPYDSNARRHTSFCSVFVSPVIDDSIEIDIKESDLRVDTYRASGAGGQHVNRTDSAVRITHMPTNTVVQCQSERSQIQNREMCMKMMRSKLYELEIERRKSEQRKIEDAKMENSFGSQIRSYVLHPYKMVKDLRTHYQINDPDVVLDGDLEGFSLEFLRQSASGQFKGKGSSGADDLE